MTDAPDLKALRKRHGLTLDQVAAATGYSKPHVWAIENGRSKRPSADFMVAIARLYGLSLDRFLGLDANSMVADETEMLQVYRSLNADDKRAAVRVVRAIRHSATRDREARDG